VYLFADRLGINIPLLPQGPQASFVGYWDGGWKFKADGTGLRDGWPLLQGFEWRVDDDVLSVDQLGVRRRLRYKFEDGGNKLILTPIGPDAKEPALVLRRVEEPIGWKTMEKERERVQKELKELERRFPKGLPD
jgi:hypothetical protein